MTLGDMWCTVDEAKQFIAEPYPTDHDIEAAIRLASGTLLAAFCHEPADSAPENTYPDSAQIRQATAILTAQWLTATPMGAVVDGIEAETIGGYSYKTRKPGRSKATALRIDGVVRELVAPYLCDGYGAYTVETMRAPKPLEGDFGTL